MVGSASVKKQLEEFSQTVARARTVAKLIPSQHHQVIDTALQMFEGLAHTMRHLIEFTEGVESTTSELRGYVLDAERRLAALEVWRGSFVTVTLNTDNKTTIPLGGTCG